MAVTLDQILGGGNAGASTTATMSTSAAVASGGMIIVVAGRFNTTTANTMAISGGGLVWTQDHTNSIGSIRVSIFSAPAPSGLASSTTLTLTHSGTSPINTDSIFGGASFLGIDTVGTAVSTAQNNASAAATWAAGSITPTAGNMLIGGAFQDGTATTTSTATTGTEFLDRNIVGQSETTSANYHLSPAGATNIGGNWLANATYIAAAVQYKASSGAAAFMPDAPRFYRQAVNRSGTF